MNILIAGDFCPQSRVAKLFEQSDYESVLGDVKDVISEADYSIVNLECPITKGGESPIEKCGPNLQCSESGMDAVKWAGFNCVTLANNHFLDYGEAGVANTLEACQKYGIDVVGGGRNLQEAARILYKEINGQTLAVINCCEHEFSIATKTTAGSNPLNPIQQYYAIQEAKQKADYVLVIVHGGHEHYQLPSTRMQDTYRFFIDAGADAVVNHHQHCYSGYEMYRGKMIYYGLGNFCFDKKKFIKKTWNYGFIVSICFSDNITTQIYPYYQCGETPQVQLLKPDSFCDNIEKMNAIISSPKRLNEEICRFYSQNPKSLSLIFEPYTHRFLCKLYLLSILPSFLTSSKKNKLLNVIQCESHRDKVLYNLVQKQFK